MFEIQIKNESEPEYTAPYTKIFFCSSKKTGGTTIFLKNSLKITLVFCLGIASEPPQMAHYTSIIAISQSDHERTNP